jgi:hypothetical protein
MGALPDRDAALPGAKIDSLPDRGMMETITILHGAIAVAFVT